MKQINLSEDKNDIMFRGKRMKAYIIKIKVADNTLDMIHSFVREVSTIYIPEKHLTYYGGMIYQNEKYNQKKG